VTARRTHDPDEERGRKILRQLDKLERKKPRPRFLGCLPWALALFVLLLIALVVILNLDKFQQYWQHLFHPAAGFDPGS